MAVATATRRDITVTLEMTEQEALYVYDALRNVVPTPESGVYKNDPVFKALNDILRKQDVNLYDDIERAQVISC